MKNEEVKQSAESSGSHLNDGLDIEYSKRYAFLRENIFNLIWNTDPIYSEEIDKPMLILTSLEISDHFRKCVPESMDSAIDRLMANAKLSRAKPAQNETADGNASA